MCKQKESLHLQVGKKKNTYSKQKHNSAWQGSKGLMRILNVTSPIQPLGPIICYAITIPFTYGPDQL